MSSGLAIDDGVRDQPPSYALVYLALRHDHAPLTVEEISKTTGLSGHTVRSALEWLVETDRATLHRPLENPSRGYRYSVQEFHKRDNA